MCLHRARLPFQELHGASGASYRAGLTPGYRGVSNPRGPEEWSERMTDEVPRRVSDNSSGWLGEREVSERML
jgi:hypothetical protein